MSSTIEPPCPSIDRLEAAMRAVLKDSFEVELQAVVESAAWFHGDLPPAELLRLWICDNLENREDPQWIFRFFRPTERKYLTDQLGIPRSEILGKTPRQVASLVMLASGLPCLDLLGVQAVQTQWAELHRLVSNEEDEKAAVLCRQRAERLLREIVVFYCSVGHSEHFVEIIKDPGNLRLPGKLVKEVVGGTPEERATQLVAAFGDDGLADLGFLAMALRKFSARIYDAGAKHVSGASLNLFDVKDHEAFVALGTALQAYHHDKPSRFATRRSELLASVELVRGAIHGMAVRRVLPDELFVTEGSCRTPFGKAFRGITDSGKIRCLTTEATPRLAQRIRYVAATERDYARCLWREAIWVT